MDQIRSTEAIWWVRFHQNAQRSARSIEAIDQGGPFLRRRTKRLRLRNGEHHVALPLVLIGLFRNNNSDVRYLAFGAAHSFPGLLCSLADCASLPEAVVLSAEETRAL